VTQVPECFIGIKMEEGDLRKGHNELEGFHIQLQGDVHFLSTLGWLLKIEKRFERIHIGASLVISDQQLKQLFQTLTEGDLNHIGTLKNLIAGLEGA
jgi:hypothetical protein